MSNLKIGLASTVPYFLFFIYCLLVFINTGEAQSQVMLAVFSFPTSILVLIVFDPVLNWMGPYGDNFRRIGEWGFLALAGGLQYFFIGFILAREYSMKDE